MHSNLLGFIVKRAKVSRSLVTVHSRTRFFHLSKSPPMCHKSHDKAQQYEPGLINRNKGPQDQWQGLQDRREGPQMERVPGLMERAPAVRGALRDSLHRGPESSSCTSDA